MGARPSWYRAAVAAELLHVPLWEVLERSTWYQDVAHIKAQAENQAQEQLEQMRRKGY